MDGFGPKVHLYIPTRYRPTVERKETVTLITSGDFEVASIIRSTGLLEIFTHNGVKRYYLEHSKNDLENIHYRQLSKGEAIPAKQNIGLLVDNKISKIVISAHDTLVAEISKFNGLLTIYTQPEESVADIYQIQSSWTGKRFKFIMSVTLH